MHRALVAILLAAPFTACLPSPGSCDEDDRKEAVLTQARSWYLYPELLPDAVDLDAYPSAQALLDDLTADAFEAGLDRGWSFVISREEYEQYAVEARNVGFGFSWGTMGEPPWLRVFLSDVFEGSAAAAAGFLRGDEILAVGPSGGELTPVADLTPDQVWAFSSPGGLAGVSRSFRVAPRGGGPEVVRTMTSRVYDVDPVPVHQIWDSGTGYVQLRTFIQPAEAPLRAVFREFADAGVENVIVDLRYNGGGLLSTAEVLANLLADDLAGRTMYDLHYNARHAYGDERHSFRSEPDGGTFQRIAFITGSGSASASELVPHALDAHRPPGTLAFVGGRTHGKPVGQVGWELRGCDTILFLIAFRLANAEGITDYFDGLPAEGSTAPLCEAADDLQHDMGSVDEALTAAARHFVETGSCFDAAPQLRAGAPEPSLRMPVGVGSSAAARDIPGLL